MRQQRLLQTVILSCLAGLVLLFAACAFCIPAQYDDTFTGELKYKCARLADTPGKRIIVIGGSGMAFALDSEKLEEAFPHHGAVNMGMYAALGSRMMLELTLADIHRGDILIFAPEQNTQTLSGFFDPKIAWQSLDGAYGLIPRTGMTNLPHLMGALPQFSMDKLRYAVQKKPPEGEGIYRRASFNEYGDIEAPEVRENTMAAGYDPDTPVSYDSSLPTEDFIRFLNRYNRAVKRRGATLYFHFCPADRLAVSGNPEAFYRRLEKHLDFEILGDPRQAVMDPAWFFDTNFHLNAKGRTLFTRTLIRDLKAAYGVTAKTDIPIPEKPSAHFHDPGSPAQTESAQSVLSAKTYAGNTEITTIKIPASVTRIEDRAFDGCTGLQEIRLESSSPSKIQVGSHLLDGTNAKLSVPEKALSSYLTDYRFSRYADRITSY